MTLTTETAKQNEKRVNAALCVRSERIGCDTIKFWRSTCTEACSLIVYVAQSMYGLRSIHACLLRVPILCRR